MIKQKSHLANLLAATLALIGIGMLLLLGWLLFLH